MILIGKDVNEGYWRRGSHLDRGFVHAPCAKIGQILSGLVAQQAQVALPSFGARTYECYQNERSIPTCEPVIVRRCLFVRVVLRDGGFFACSSLSMKCAGSLGFDAANKLVGAIRSEFGFQS